MRMIIDSIMNLIAFEIGAKPFDAAKAALTDEQLLYLFKCCKQHDLAHLVGDALIKNHRIANPEIEQKFKRELIFSVLRYEQTNHELERLRNVLREAKIAFIPLKGAVLRQYYPEPWMRTSCDIDILVHEQQADQAAKIIVEKLGYTYNHKNYHDISLYLGDNIHLELHYSIKENKENIDPLLSQCWDYAQETDSNEYHFSNEFLLFHQYAHASYHFLNGGCGIRPLIDIYLLEKQLSFDRCKLNQMLSQTGIDKFAKYMSELSLVWFEGKEYTLVTKHMASFILNGGVYGTNKNSVAINQQQDKGLFGYVLRRVWIPYDHLCVKYPQLKQHPYFMPLYQVKRWVQALAPQSRKRITIDVNFIKNLSDEKKANTELLLKELGLFEYV